MQQVLLSVYLFFHSFEAISDNSAKLQHGNNIMLEFNTLDDVFRSDFAEISLEK